MILVINFVNVTSIWLFFSLVSLLLGYRNDLYIMFVDIFYIKQTNDVKYHGHINIWNLLTLFFIDPK